MKINKLMNDEHLSIIFIQITRFDVLMLFVQYAIYNFLFLIRSTTDRVNEMYSNSNFARIYYFESETKSRLFIGCPPDLKNALILLGDIFIPNLNLHAYTPPRNVGKIGTPCLLNVKQ